jgi:addiction module HigA family antidote
MRPPASTIYTFHQAIAWNRSGVTAMASTGPVSENSASTTSSGSALSGQKQGLRRSRSLTSTDVMLVPPGEVLLEEFLRPMGISQYRLALAIGVPESRINAIVKGRRAITADTDLRLCRFFGLSDGFWLRMQGSHDLKLARQALISVLPAIEPIQPMA